MPRIKLVNHSNPLKVANSGKLEGYLVRFSSPDDTDLVGEWFSKNTYFMRSNGYPVKGAPINYNHNFDENFGPISLGIFDFVDENDIGLLVTGALHELEKYEEMLVEIGRRKGVNITDGEITKRASIAKQAVDELIATVPLRMSMGADIAAFQVNEETGHIDMCGIVHGALTPTPADDENPVVKFDNLIKAILPKRGDGIKVKQGATLGDASKERGEGKDHEGKTRQKKKVGGNKMQPKTKALTPEELAMIREQFIMMLDALLDELSMPVDEAQKEAMAEEMEEEFEKVIEEDDEIKADVEDKKDGDKALDEEDAAEIAAKTLPQIIPGKVREFVAKKEAAANTRRKGTSKAAKALYDQPVSSKSQVGGVQQDRRAERVEMVDLRYDHLSPEVMALGLKIAFSASNPGLSAVAAKRVKIGDLVSEDYARAMAAKIADSDARHEPIKPIKHYDQMLANDRRMLKRAMPFKADELDAIAITNQGAEWGFIWYDTRLWERARPETLLFNMLVEKGMRTADVQGTTMDVKLNTGSPTVYTAPEARSVGADGRPEVTAAITPFTTNNVAVDLKEHKLASSHTDKLDEQSIIAIAEFIDDEAAITIAEALEDALINGDTTTTSANINTSTTPAVGLRTPLYIAWNGIRHNALVEHTDYRRSVGAALTVDDFERTIHLLDYAIRQRKQNMLFIIDGEIESMIRRLVELKTKDVAGESATIFTGSIPPLFGVDTYSSGFMVPTLADGTISDVEASNTRGGIAAVYAPYWQYGRQRSVTIEVDRDIQAGATIVVASVSHVLAARGASAAALSYNITVGS